MKYQIIVFEDDAVCNLFPLSLNRHVAQLRCGAISLAERIERQYPGHKTAWWCRSMLADFLAEQTLERDVNQAYDAFLMINGRLLADENTPRRIPAEGPDCAYTHQDTLVAMRLSGTNAAALKFERPFSVDSIPSGVERKEIDAVMIDYPWELVNRNGEMIGRDFQSVGGGGLADGRVYDGVHMKARANIRIGPGATIAPGVVLDAEEGPIWIDENACILPHCAVVGPVYIGRNSIIKIGAKIYENTSIGEVCKVGGEVDASIIHGYSNKQHEGFLGHAYMGMWNNLGAGTSNSDLKNNYGNVRMTINGREVDTGSQFVGSAIGDHSKTAINTVLNTGTVIGLGCNIFGAGFPPKYIPSFCWGGVSGITSYRFDKFIEVAKSVMARRKKNLSETEERLLQAVYENTRQEREVMA
jgi:UDP-N-acetylglucosamine diphosphorylase/glucosamine-1-phosphate N-acetyltransferase